MEANRIAESYPKADIQLWGKGYRITTDSEEFQRYLPKDSAQPRGLEKKIQTSLSGGLLESLYPLRDVEIASLRCVLFDTSDLLSVSFAKTEDRHHRPSLVLTTCIVGIDWRNPQLGEITARAVALSSRLATTYAEALRGNPEPIGRQLRDNSFVTSRSFHLGAEHPDQIVDWARVISAVKKWSGITGVSAPRLLGLSANVVLGTKFEAEQAKQQFQVDGLFDVREREITALSDRLRLWEPKPELHIQPSQERPGYPRPPAASSQEQEAFRPSPELRLVAECLQQLNRTMDRVADLAAEILERLGREKRRK